MILDGKKLSNIVKDEVKNFINENKINLSLAVVLVGSDPASQIYVRNKKIACEYVGINSLVYELEENISQDYLLNLIDELNNREDVNGILVQLPLPKHINESVVMKNISPLKDVDGFNPENVGSLVLGAPKFVPCTPLGIMKILDHYNIEIDGKRCVVIGRSNDVGKPIASLLMAKNGTVTVCHSHTKNLDQITKTADILVSAVGKAKFIKSNMVKEGATLIDVGMNRVDGKLYGDIDFEDCSEVKEINVTPVPGGVGPMTIAMLIKNCVYAWKLQLGDA